MCIIIIGVAGTNINWPELGCLVGIPFGILFIEWVVKDSVVDVVRKYAGNNVQRGNLCFKLVVGVKAPLGLSSCLTALAVLGVFIGLSYIIHGDVKLTSLFVWSTIIIIISTAAAIVMTFIHYWTGLMSRIAICIREQRQQIDEGKALALKQEAVTENLVTYDSTEKDLDDCDKGSLLTVLIGIFGTTAILSAIALHICHSVIMQSGIN